MAHCRSASRTAAPGCGRASSTSDQVGASHSASSETRPLSSRVTRPLPSARSLAGHQCARRASTRVCLRRDLCENHSAMTFRTLRDSQLRHCPRPAVACGTHAVGANAPSTDDRHMEIARAGSRPPTKGAPKTPGVDFAGVVEAVGAKVTGFAVGDRVFGYPGSMRKGTLSEIVSVPAASAARIPRGLDDVGAASVAMVGLAALQALRDVAHVAPNERVLVNGATGGVGLMLIQLARLRGAHVTAVASTKGVTVARQFGAEQVVDYRSESIAGESW
ncbi:MAG: NAD(P)-dependent alcohol dehydrogenase [Deltaproteobacteria bacterium]